MKRLLKSEIIDCYINSSVYFGKQVDFCHHWEAKCIKLFFLMLLEFSLTIFSDKWNKYLIKSKLVSFFSFFLWTQV